MTAWKGRKHDNSPNGDSHVEDRDPLKLLDVEWIERNAAMPKRDELTDNSYLIDRLQTIFFSMLYAGICVSATPIVVVYFFIDVRLMRFCEKYCFQREIQVNSMTLGEGLLFYLELMTGLVVITNTFLLFYLSTNFKSLIFYLFGLFGRTASS
jgi:hypothetical protein